VSQQSDQPEGAAAPVPLGADFIIPVLACGLTAYYVLSTLDLVWEAKVTGLFIGAILVALCVVHFVRLGRQLASGRGNLSFGELVNNDLFNRQRLGLLVLVTLFIVTIHWVGTTLGLFLLLIGCMWILGVRNIRTLVGVAFTTAAVVYVLLIHLLGSKLPRGPVEQLLALVGGAS
jgi:hypothetical protein